MSERSDMPAPPRRALWLSYGSGLLSMGQMDLLQFIVPLWALHLGANATEVGIVAGARSVLPFILAIHGGVLMDRLGTRRIMAASAISMIVAAPLFPGLPWVPALVVLQLVTGYATTIAWVGSQTVIAQVCRGDTGYLGKYNFAGRIGTFLAPILMGLLWDFTNPWLTFLFVGLWAAALLAISLATEDPAPPEGEAAGAPEPAGAPPNPSRAARLRAVLPKGSDYLSTFALLLIPAIAISISGSFLRNTTSAVQGSIYVVYLNDIGLTGTAIGALFAAIEGASAIGALLAGRVARRFAAYTLLLGTTAAGIFLINATPLLGGIFALLFAAQVLRGLIQGVNQPVLFGIQARAAGPHRQGATVALRVTVNRFVSMTLPPIMGIVADTAGIEASFYLLGGVLLAMTAGLAVLIRFAPAGEA
ncbi:MAG: MFS transporter [Alphaproteobacteria bacterium]|nr:MFS transporter [Alphaproteobacteria bacterium]